MKIDEYGTKIIERGDKIKCQGLLITVATCHYQDYDKNHDTFIAEFYDTNGNIRNWHQNTDGGVLIPKPETKEIWIGFEMSDSRGGDSINNYDVMKIFDDEKSAIEWRNDNFEYRAFKYGGKVALSA